MWSRRLPPGTRRLVAVIAGVALVAGLVVTGIQPAAAAGAPGTIDTAFSINPRDVAVAPNGRIYTAQGEDGIFEIYPDGSFGRVVEDPNPGSCLGPPSFDEDTSICNVTALAFDAAGDLYFVDRYLTYSVEFPLGRSARIFKVTPPVSPTFPVPPVRIAGTGTHAGHVNGDGGLAVDAQIHSAEYGLSVAADGKVYFSDGNAIRVIDQSTGILDLYAGRGAGFGGDGGPAIDAGFGSIRGLAHDGVGNLLVSDHTNARLRRIDTAGIVNTVAGNGSVSFSGDGGPATAAGTRPWDVEVDASGNIFIADRNVDRVRMVNTGGQIMTIAGTGTAGSTGDGGPATEAQLNTPDGLALEPSGSLLVAEVGVRRVEPLASSTTGAMTGRVTETDGVSGVSGVVVTVLGEWPSWAPVANAVTGATGTWSVPGLAPGSYRVRFWDPTGAHVRSWFDGAGTYKTAASVAVSAGTVSPVYDSLSSTPAAVTGQVTDAGSGTPLPGVAVMVVTDDGWVAGAMTGPGGYYYVGAFEPGDYKLFFFDFTFTHAPRWHPDADHVSGAVPMTLPTGVTSGVDAALPTL